MDGKAAPDAVLVLIAEDEPSIAALIAVIVQDMGYTAMVARNGREALALAHERKPTLLITDLMMPHLDGAGLISALRADHGRTVPVILMTAALNARALAVDADAVLSKPFDISTLEALLGELLPL